jgi:hypothetical protein
MVFSESGNKRVSRRTHGLLLLYLSKSSWVAEHVCSFLSALKNLDNNNMFGPRLSVPRRS